MKSDHLISAAWAGFYAAQAGKAAETRWELEYPFSSDYSISYERIIAKIEPILGLDFALCYALAWAGIAPALNLGTALQPWYGVPVENFST